MIRCGEMGIEVNSRHWGKAIAAVAGRAALDYFFESMKLHRVESWTVEENIASHRWLKRLGFSFEGVMRSKGFWKGSFRDLYLYSILKGENTVGPPARSDAGRTGRKSQSHEDSEAKDR